MTDYETTFQRNYGVFTREEQERIRAAHVLIIGCGGIGGTVALCLARSGVEHFSLVEFDCYEPTNMNRQIACFANTLGRHKGEVISEQIRAINPQADVELHPRLLGLEEMDPLIAQADLVFPAADDFAFSQLCFRKARQMQKPALYVIPAGLWAYACLLLPSGPLVEDLNGMPVFETYEEIRDFYNSPVYRNNSGWYVRNAGWQPDYQQAFARHEKPVPQICPVVWTASSLGALQAVKLLAGRRKLVTAPRIYWLSENNVRVVNVHGLSLPGFWRASRILYWKWLKLTGKI